MAPLSSHVDSRKSAARDTTRAKQQQPVDPPGENQSLTKSLTLDQDLDALEAGGLFTEGSSLISREVAQDNEVPDLDSSETESSDGERSSGRPAVESDQASVGSTSQCVVEDVPRYSEIIQGADDTPLADMERGAVQCRIEQDVVSDAITEEAPQVQYEDQLQSVGWASINYQHPDEVLHTQETPTSGARPGMCEDNILVVHAVQVAIEEASTSVDETPHTSCGRSELEEPSSLQSKSPSRFMSSLSEDEKSFLVKIMMVALFLNTVFAVAVVVAGFCLAGACGGDDNPDQPAIPISAPAPSGPVPVTPTVTATVPQEPIPTLSPTIAPAIASPSPTKAPTSRTKSVPVPDTGAFVSNDPLISRPAAVPVSAGIIFAVSPQSSPSRPGTLGVDPTSIGDQPPSPTPTQPSSNTNSIKKRLQQVTVLVPATIVIEALLMLAFIAAYRKWKTRSRSRRQRRRHEQRNGSSGQGSLLPCALNSVGRTLLQAPEADGPSPDTRGL